MTGKRILIIGGTRLFGLALVRELCSQGHIVTVVSRRTTSLPEGARLIQGIRSESWRALEQQAFDAVFDFLAYDEASVAEALRYLPSRALYVLISSIWMVRLQTHAFADQFIGEPEPGALAALPEVTQKYLLGKWGAERLFSVVQAKRPVAVLRMPIFWGKGEHTGRIRFYADRVADGRPVLLVDGGSNLTQVVWVEDLARATAKWLISTKEPGRLIWEGLPNPGVPLREIVTQVARGLGRSPEFKAIPAEVLATMLPEYLEAEPLWRERALPVTGGNLFAITETSATPVAEWLPGCAAFGAGDGRLDLRSRELEILGKST
jgi:nucleoside-diphosphate-sugar epimerase